MKDTTPFLSDDPEIRRAEAVVEVKNPITGWKTWIGIGITITARIFKHYHVEIPTDDVMGFVNTLERDWPFILELFGEGVALWGIIHAKIRHKEAVAVVTVVTEKLVEAKVETAEAKTELEETKIDLHVKTVELAEVAKSIPTPKK